MNSRSYLGLKIYGRMHRSALPVPERFPLLLSALELRSGFLRPGALIFCLLTAFLLSAGQLHAQSQMQSDSGAQEVYLTFSYSLGLVNTVVTALYIEPEIYLPAGEIFRLLRINYSYDADLKILKGFYITESRTYEMDFQTGRVSVGTADFAFQKGEFAYTAFEVYLRPELFERLFGLRFTVDMSKLTLSLETDAELPVVAGRNREQQQKLLESENASKKEYPLMYPRRRISFDGGLLDYSVTAALSGREKSYGYDLRGGGIVAGGDLEMAVNGNYSASSSASTEAEGRWRYVIEGTPYISSIGAGYIFSGGLFPRNYKGIRVSNEPVQARTLFQSYIIEQRTHPLWTVELYLNERLVDMTAADALGRYRFVVPLAYGTTNYSVRTYGPTGEMYEERQRIQIPFSLIPSGEIDYALDAGSLRENNDRFFRANVSAGLLPGLTSGGGVEFADDSLYAKPVGYVSLSSWLNKNYILAADAAPGVLYRAGITAVYASQISAGLSIAEHKRNEFYNPSRMVTEVQSNLSIPFIIAAAPVTYRLQANRQNYENSTAAFVTTGTTVSYGQINGTVEYRLSELKYAANPAVREPVISSSLLYMIMPGEKLASVTTGILIGSSFAYNLGRNKADELRFDFSSNITASGRLQFSYSRDFTRDQYAMTIQFLYEFPFARSTTTAFVYAGSTSIIQNIRGTAGYDSYRHDFHSNNLESAGLSALSVHMFVDRNGDGAYNSDEQTIDNASFSLGQASFIDKGDSGITIVRRLLPYTHYNIDIAESSISNPLWMPKTYNFSLITEPDVYKPIDVPFYATGITEGSVLMQRGDVLEAVPGIEIHIRSLDGKYHKDVRVFADGTFYQVGVPPGIYIAYVDSAQLRILKAYSEPPFRPFDVKITADGDYVEGVKFILRKNETVESDPAINDK